MPKPLKLGDALEVAMWADGRETPAMLKQFDADIAEAFERAAETNHVRLGPVEMTTKRPGEERVPICPISGPDVRLIVAETKVIGTTIPKKREAPGFVHDLEPDDLARLRVITRRNYEREYPGRRRLTDRQCDTLINDLGPKAALDTLKGATRTMLQ